MGHWDVSNSDCTEKENHRICTGEKLKIKISFQNKRKVKYISNKIAGRPKNSERCGHGTLWFCEKLIHKK